MKICGRCRQLLGDDCFYIRRRRGRVELTGYCRVCAREHGRPWRRLYTRSARGREVQRASNARRRPRTMPVLTAEQLGERYLAHRRAAAAVYRAVKAGRLVRPSACSACDNSDQRPEAHHANGYDRAHHLDVTWLCRHCHEIAHHPTMRRRSANPRRAELV